MDDIEGFDSFLFRDLQETRGKVDVKTNLFYLSSQCYLVPTNGTTEEVQETADARCRERRCCRHQPKEKIVNVEPPTVQEEQELMAEDGWVLLPCGSTKRR